MKKWLLVSLMALSATSAFATYYEVDVPRNATPIQDPYNENDKWTCGPISAGKMLAYYHGQDGQDPVISCHDNVDFEIFRNDCPRSLDGTKMPTQCESVGPIPTTLAEYMNQHSKPVQYEAISGATVEQIISRIKDNHPVLALLKVGTLRLIDKIPGQEIENLRQIPVVSSFVGILERDLPLMHYVVVKGYDDEKETLTYLDTDAKEVEVSIKRFQEQWDWTVDLSGNGNLQTSNFLKLLISGLLTSYSDLPEGLKRVSELLNVSGNTMIVAKQEQEQAQAQNQVEQVQQQMPQGQIPVHVQAQFQAQAQPQNPGQGMPQQQQPQPQINMMMLLGGFLQQLQQGNK